MQFNKRHVPIKQWSGEYLGQILAVDTETDVRPFYEIAKLQTMQVYNGKAVYYVLARDVANFEIEHEASIQIMHNAPFDLDVIGQVAGGRERTYYKLDNKRVFDTNILYKLWHLAHIGFTPKRSSLAHCCSSLLGIELDKNTDIRCTFEQYKNVPVSEIPVEHLEYGAKDAVATWDLYFVLMSRIKQYDIHNTLLSYDIQIKGAVALDQIYKNGIKLDLEARDKWLANINKQMEVEADILATYGWVRGKKGIKDIYENIIHYLDLHNVLPRTEDGSISSKREDLEQYNDSPFIASYLKFIELEKASTFVRDIHTERIHPRYSLLMNTGRTSCSGSGGACNIQQIPRVGGIRELFVPEKGKRFVDIDYSALELAGLAQVCISEFGFSKMAELINEGKCLHYYTASNVYRKPESEVTKDERQFSKIPNFAFPTNMSPNTFIQYCAGYGVPMTLEQAEELKRAYAKTYPEISEHFWRVPNGVDRNVTLTGRVRANCTYTAYLNTKFQGLCADGAKLALYNVAKAGYKIVAFIHDQIMIESDIEDAEKDMDKVQQIMIESMKEVIPDVKISTEGQILERWCK